MKRSLLLLGVLCLVSPMVIAQDAGAPSKEGLESAYPEKPHSPYAGETVPTKVYWGDTHLHTATSMDAGAFGARLTPEDAFQFACGDRAIPGYSQILRDGIGTTGFRRARASTSRWSSSISSLAGSFRSLWSIGPTASPTGARGRGLSTPRRSTTLRDYGLEFSDEIPMTTQERAYTSPIWYTP